MAPQGGCRLVQVRVGVLARVQNGEEKTLELASGSLVEGGRLWWTGGAEELRVGVEPFLIVDVEQACDTSAGFSFAVCGRRRVESGGAAELGPGAVAAVEVVEFETGLMEIVRKRGVAQLSKLLDPLSP